MAKKSEGKKFEEDIEKSIGQQGYFVHRIKDMGNQFMMYKDVKNMADFISYAYPCMIVVECKSHKGKSFPFGVIDGVQLQKLFEADRDYHGIVGGYLFNFRDVEKTYFVRVEKVYQFIENAERKSIPLKWCEEEGEELKGNKKITRFTYNIERLYDYIIRGERGT